MNERLESIDLLRGIAIVMVFLFHFYGSTYGRDSLPWLGNWPDWDAFRWQSFHHLYFLRMGRSGVALFFVLSGFCIHHSYLRRRKADSIQSTWEFYWHRFFRIYPPYLFALFVFLLFDPGAWRLNTFAHITFTHSLASNKDIFFGINPSFWSLPVEFHLYLIYPIFLWVHRNRGIRLALCLTLVFTLIFQFAVPSTGSFRLKGLPFAYWFYWAIGAYVADKWYSTGSKAFRYHSFVIPLLSALFVLSNYYRPFASHEWMIHALLYAYVLDALLHSRPSVAHSALLRAVSGVGLVSYSMYLWHQPLLPRMSALCLTTLGLPAHPAAMFGVCLPMAFVILWMLSRWSYRLLELSSVDFGRRYWPGIREWKWRTKELTARMMARSHAIIRR